MYLRIADPEISRAEICLDDDHRGSVLVVHRPLGPARSGSGAGE